LHLTKTHRWDIYQSAFSIYHLSMSGTIYLIATPIGNLRDISLRALDVLRNVDVVACEDTRHSGKLLKHFNIKKKLLSYHDHNEISRSDELIELTKSGKSIALVTDAGTPGISDPGFRIVQKAHENEIIIVPIPGPVAFVNALIISGLPTDSIFFGGFLPSKASERRKRLKEMASIRATICFYESPHRISKCLEDCIEILGNRKAVIVRELTKLHEEVIRGSLNDLHELSKKNIRGEIVLLIDREQIDKNTLKSSKSVSDRIAELEESGIDQKHALKQTAKEMGMSKSEAYRILQSEKSN